jgi:hypothetical protein
VHHAGSVSISRERLLYNAASVLRENWTPMPDFFSRLSTYVANALRYWEPRRLIYNGTLAAVVLAHVVLAWPASREKLSPDLLMGFFLLAVLANVAYSAVYVVDLFVQFSGLDRPWPVGRPVLLFIGTAFAGIITHFVVQGEF